MADINWITELRDLATLGDDPSELPDTAKITYRLIKNKLLSKEKADMVWEAMVYRARYLRNSSVE